MNGSNSILVDTNIVLYLIDGDETIAELLHGKSVFVSFINELELLGYGNSSINEIALIEGFLQDVAIIDINNSIKEKVIEIRKKSKTKLPDAIVAATAQYLNIPLISADKGFAGISNLNFILYEP
jgi:predicted nucleic acid-binding protein